MAGLVNGISEYEHKKTRRGALESEAWRVLLKEVYAVFKGAVKQNYSADFCAAII
jgi:hypothetical protein